MTDARNWLAEAAGTVASVLIAFLAGLVGAVLLAGATGAVFRVVLRPGATSLRAALTAVAAMFVVGAAVLLTIALLQRVNDLHHRHQLRELRNLASRQASDRDADR